MIFVCYKAMLPWQSLLIEKLTLTLSLMQRGPGFCSHCTSQHDGMEIGSDAINLNTEIARIAGGNVIFDGHLGYWSMMRYIP